MQGTASFQHRLSGRFPAAVYGSRGTFGVILLTTKSGGNTQPKVTYSNGVRFYINYGEQTAAADGFTIEPMSYIIVE